MTQEDKDLLLKDLCARLPYGVKVKDTYYNYDENSATIWLLDLNTQKVRIFADEDWQSIEYIKPYLFPLSSITEEQREELYKIGWYLDEDKIYSCFRNYDDANYKTHIDSFELINWCYKNNFDINGLIPMGLAIDATGLNIY